MSTFFSSSYSDFAGHTGSMTISTGPVVVHTDGLHVLLHISASTGRYQYIGGRLDDTLSFRENAVARAAEVLGTNTVYLHDDPPTILLDDIQRDGHTEKILLIHYRAHIHDETDIHGAGWYTLAEIEDMAMRDMLSSPNVLICSRHFLGNNI